MTPAAKTGASPASRWVAALLLMAVLPALAIGKPDPRHEALADAVFAASRAEGMVLAVVDAHGTQVLGRGRQAPDRIAPPDGDSLLRINSLSKVMAAELLAGDVQAARLALDTPLADYSDGRPVPGGDAITLVQLATHTAGIPRDMPDDSWPADAAPNTWPDAATRWRWLATLPAPREPGRHALYSTPGFLFLGDALAAASGQPYTVLLRNRLSAPLGMHDTTAAPDAAQCRRLLRAASRDPLRYTCADSSATAASAGMYSTADDIALWMRAMLAAEQAGGYRPWQAQLRREALATIEGLDGGGRADAIGLGWIRLADGDARTTIVQKTGAGGGFSSYLAFVPARGIGVFVATSHYDPEAMSALTAQVNAWLMERSADDERRSSGVTLMKRVAPASSTAPHHPSPDR